MDGYSRDVIRVKVFFRSGACGKSHNQLPIDRNEQDSQKRSQLYVGAGVSANVWIRMF